MLQNEGESACVYVCLRVCVSAHARVCESVCVCVFVSVHASVHTFCFLYCLSKFIYPESLPATLHTYNQLNCWFSEKKVSCPQIQVMSVPPIINATLRKCWSNRERVPQAQLNGRPLRDRLMSTANPQSSRHTRLYAEGKKHRWVFMFLLCFYMFPA